MTLETENARLQFELSCAQADREALRAALEALGAFIRAEGIALLSDLLEQCDAALTR